MAVSWITCPHILVRKSGAIPRPLNKIRMPRSSFQSTIRKSNITFGIKSSLSNKVFEDQSEGVICYMDDRGDIICEGYDEGPRFHQHISPSYHPRDVEILDLLLQQRWIQMVNGSELMVNGVDKGVVSVLEDFIN